MCSCTACTPGTATPASFSGAAEASKIWVCKLVIWKMNGLYQRKQQIVGVQLHTQFRCPSFSKKGYRTNYFLKKFTFLKFLKSKASDFYHPKNLSIEFDVTQPLLFWMHPHKSWPIWYPLWHCVICKIKCENGCLSIVSNFRFKYRNALIYISNLSWP